MRTITWMLTVLVSATFMFVSAPALIMNTDTAFAGQSCKSGYYYDKSRKACVKRVKQRSDQQDAAASGGPQWGPPSKAACAQASREMDDSMALCRRYDKGDGKDLEECAKCCRQLREGANRWQVCHRLGFAPEVDWTSINASKERLGCTW